MPSANQASKRVRFVGTVVCKRRRALEIVCGAIGRRVVMKVNVLLGTMKRVVRIVATAAARLDIEPVTKAVHGTSGTIGVRVLVKGAALPNLMRIRPVATAVFRVGPAVILVIGSPGRPAQAKGSVPRTPSKIRKRLAGIVVLVIANGPAVMVVSGIHGKNGPHA